MAKQTRYEIIRDFETQLVYARTAFPMGTKGLQLKQGVITPNGEELQQALNLWGPAVKPGDPAHISFVQIKNDHIHFEINGGPVFADRSGTSECRFLARTDRCRLDRTSRNPIPTAPISTCISTSMFPR
jgi:hypothetical protein